jgi:hypothetical protein
MPLPPPPLPQVRYSNGEYESLGHLDVFMSDTPFAALNISVGDRIKELAIWTDPASMVVQVSTLGGPLAQTALAGTCT